MLARFKMSHKIIGGFVVVVLMLGATIAYQILVAGRLAILQDMAIKRSWDVTQLNHVMETIDMSYGVISDAIINRKMDRTKTALAELKDQFTKDIAVLKSIVDTDAEKAWADTYAATVNDYMAIFSQEMLPVLEGYPSDMLIDQSTMANLIAQDELLDEKRELADTVLRKIILSLEEEVKEANQLFNAARAQSITLATIIATLSSLLAMVIAFLLSRSITRPINTSVKELSSTSDQIASAAGQVSSSSQHLADGASEQASALEETSASMEELTSMTRQNADNADQADSLMRQSLSTINNTNAAMDEMDRSMAQIASASAETFKIIKTIDEIAFQTNLLALNAAVEAARAGEAGAGFAVVADEVRNLAMRATEAAKNTAQLIEDTVHKVNAGKEIVVKVTGAFREVTESSTKVGSLLGEISTASREQSKGIAQINQAIVQMDTVTQTNAASSEESAAAAEELNAQAEAMIDIVMTLRSLVEGQQHGVAGRPPRPTAKSQPLSPPAESAAPKHPKPAAPGKAPRKPALPAPPPPARKAPAATGKKAPATDPESVIPMDDDDNFADF